MALYILFATLIILSVIAYLLGSLPIFTACSAVAGGGFIFALALTTMEVEKRLRWLACALLFWGVFYLILYALLTLKKIRRERKRRRQEIERRLCYTLPDRGNSYVRARLNTALQCRKMEEEADMDIPNDGKLIKLEYVTALMKALKSANLSRAEGVRVEELARAFSMYACKERWDGGDLNALNELCGQIIKLSAKYNVDEGA